ncbi:hypothetical protein HLPCO_000422 [Haloplasma contractile SSD-17B]|uniref:Uncharacterized protein n=1 Tax=Haloplasma contractile SSD-17B TaxID=1033810 RepID=U2EGL3_9MOLU|nr:hypothetical protein HLPCO_000422 [Haloplasma contractile SSD-17B]
MYVGCFNFKIDFLYYLTIYLFYPTPFFCTALLSSELTFDNICILDIFKYKRKHKILDELQKYYLRININKNIVIRSKFNFKRVSI